MPVWITAFELDCCNEEDASQTAVRGSNYRHFSLPNTQMLYQHHLSSPRRQFTIYLLTTFKLSRVASSVCEYLKVLPQEKSEVGISPSEAVRQCHSLCLKTLNKSKEALCAFTTAAVFRNLICLGAAGQKVTSTFRKMTFMKNFNNFCPIMKIYYIKGKYFKLLFWLL